MLKSLCNYGTLSLLSPNSDSSCMNLIKNSYGTGLMPRQLLQVLQFQQFIIQQLFNLFQAVFFFMSLSFCQPFACCPRMVVRYGTFRISVLRTSHFVPYQRTAVLYFSSIFGSYHTNIVTYRTHTITKKAYRTSVPYFLAKIEACRTIPTYVQSSLLLFAYTTPQYTNIYNRCTPSKMHC